tara:strand:- start:258 stop:452 length:195 start_codon:yes stop_codon:yes gene_type:complete
MSCKHEFRENVRGQGYYCIHCLLQVAGKNRLDQIREKEAQKEEKTDIPFGIKNGFVIFSEHLLI